MVSWRGINRTLLKRLFVNLSFVDAQDIWLNLINIFVQLATTNNSPNTIYVPGC